ncbi:hypothetical protein [Kitasatospora sp. NPDC093679]|uniref:hypothetical protein n=1 Tax=Kitasatospora sp. NPDC093679 TaxID=3154983 RepID=UPI00343D36B3
MSSNERPESDTDRPAARAGGGDLAPPTHDDLMFKVVDDGPPRYTNTTDKPVEYVAVASDTSGGVIGYLWANDTDGAAGWMGRGAAGPEATNGAEPWILLMFRYKAQGLTPTEALAQMAEHPGGPVGRVVAGSRRRAESLEELRAIAKPRRWD